MRSDASQIPVLKEGDAGHVKLGLSFDPKARSNRGRNAEAVQ